MIRRARAMLTVAATLTVAVTLTVGVGTAAAKASWPARTTPLSSTHGWFEAINAHNHRRLLYYLSTEGQYQTSWARPSVAWPKFTHVRCARIRRAPSHQAHVRCTFHESASPVEGNPDSLLDFYLHRWQGAWLIDSYGQG